MSLILVPLDGSPFAVTVLPGAAYLAGVSQFSVAQKSHRDPMVTPVREA